MRRKMRTVVTESFLPVVIVCGLCNYSLAQNVFNWTDGSGNLAWTSSANWDVGATYKYPGALSSTDTAVFPAGSPTGTIAIGSPITLGAMSFANQSAGDTIAGSSISVSNGGAIVMTNVNNQGLNNTISAPVVLLGNATIENDNTTNGFWTGLLNVSGSLSGAGVLTVGSTNSGLVELSGNNSGFTGQINIVSTVANAGGLFGSAVNGVTAVNFTNGSWEGYGAVTVPIAVNAGATYFNNFGGGSTTKSITVNSGGTLTLGTGGGNASYYYGIFGGPGTIVLAGNGNVNSGWTDNWFVGTAANTLSGTVFVQSGMLNLDMTAGVNAIGTAGVTVGSNGNAAEIVWRAGNQINGTAAVTLLSAGSISVNDGAVGSGQLWLNGYSDAIAGLQDTGGSGSAVVENQAAFTTTTLTFSPSAGSSYNFGGRIRDGSGAGMGTVAIAMNGPGRQILGGANTYSGGTTVNGGTLTMNGTMNNANIQVNSGTFSGGGAITFQPGNEIEVTAGGTFDASSGSWNLAGLSSSPVDVLDFSGGGSFIAPSSGTLNSLLTPASAAKYTLADVNNVIVATLLANNLWNVDSSGTWSNSANWLHGIVPNAAGTPANFGSAITAPRTVSVNVPVTLGSMTFNNGNQYTLLATTGTNSIAFNNQGEDATIGVGAGSHAINAAIVLAGNGLLDITVGPSGSVLTISGNISEAAPGTGVINVAAGSAGTVLLSGTNGFTGGVNVNGGELIAGGGRALTSTVAVNVQSGAIFSLNSATDNQTIGSLNAQGAIALIYADGGTLNVAANGNNNVYGLAGDGTVILTASASSVTQNLGNSTFYGNLTINNGYVATPLGAANAFSVSGGTTTFNNVTWNGFGATATNFHLTGAADTFGDYGGYPELTGNVAIDPGTTVNWTTGGGNAGAIDSVISVGGEFIFVGGPGGGSFEFSPLSLFGNLANTFSGAMLVEQGTLLLQKSAGVNAIAGPLTIGYSSYTAHVLLGADEQINPAVVVAFANNTSDLRLEGFNETVGGLTSNSGNGLVGDFAASASTLTVAPVGTTTFGGTLVDGGSGSLSLVVDGSGSLTLSGSSSYSGETIVLAGELIAANPAALPGGNNLIVGDATLFSPVTAGYESAALALPGSAVPEPGTLALMIAGMLLLTGVGRGRYTHRESRRTKLARDS